MRNRASACVALGDRIDDLPMGRVQLLERRGGLGDGRSAGIAPREAHDHIGEQLEDPVARQRGEHRVEVLAQPGDVELGLGRVSQDRLEGLDGVAVDTGDDPVEHRHLEDPSDLVQVLRLDPHPIEVERHRHGGRVDAWRRHLQPPARSSTHPGHLVVLEHPDRLAQHRPADVEAGHQLRFGAEQPTHRPTPVDHVDEHLAGHALCQLRAPPVRTGEDRLGPGSIRHAATDERRLGVEVRPHPPSRTTGVAADDRLDDAGVGLDR
jgi:hypothetical protein